MFGCGGSPVDALRTDLQSEDGDARYDALKELEEQGESSGKAVPELIKLLESNDPKLRVSKCQGTVQDGPRRHPRCCSTCQRVVQLRRRQGALLRGEGASNVDEAAVVALDGLIQSAGDPDSKTRYYAVKAIGKIGKEARWRFRCFRLHLMTPMRKSEKPPSRLSRKCRSNDPYDATHAPSPTPSRRAFVDEASGQSCSARQQETPDRILLPRHDGARLSAPKHANR